MLGIGHGKIESQELAKNWARVISYLLYSMIKAKGIMMLGTILKKITIIQHLMQTLSRSPGLLRTFKTHTRSTTRITNHSEPRCAC